jgi:two-component system nitrate/nitrite response regulator NarL
VNLVLCDDHRLYLESLATALEMRGHGVTVCTRPTEAVHAVRQSTPGMVLIDMWFPDGDGIAAIAEIRDYDEECAVVVLSASGDARALQAAARAGATGFLRKEQPIAAVFDAVERVAEGRQVATPPAPAWLAKTPERSQVYRLVQQLTVREREVLCQLVQARDTVRIARSLGVAPSTARTHLANVLSKLGVHTRPQAVAMVMTAGMEAEL